MNLLPLCLAGSLWARKRVRVVHVLLAESPVDLQRSPIHLHLSPALDSPLLPFWLGAQCTFLSAWLGNLFSTGSTKRTSLNDRGVIGFLWCFGIVWFLWCFGIVLVSLAESPVDLWQCCQYPQPRNQVFICLINELEGARWNSDCHNAPRSAHCSAPKRRDDSLDPPALTLASRSYAPYAPRSYGPPALLRTPKAGPVPH